jgi:hypothetical protein
VTDNTKFVSEYPGLILSGIAVLMAVLLKLMHWFYNQYRELQKEKDVVSNKLEDAKDKVQATELRRIADRITDLVEQNKVIFAKFDNQAKSISDLNLRTTKLERGQYSQDIRWAEREKQFALVVDKIDTVASALNFAHKRKGDSPKVYRGENGCD